LLALSHAIWPPKKNFGLATLLLVTTFIQTACISLALSHSSVSNLWHSTSSFDVQSSTDKKLATTQDHQTLQYSNSCIA